MQQQLEIGNWKLKMWDPVDWNRREILGHKTLSNRVRELVTLRTWHPALQRNEVNLFYTHPKLNENDGPRVFAYCRTAGKDLGKDGQVVVVANTGPDNFPTFNLPWTWTTPRNLTEFGPRVGALNPQLSASTLVLSLAPFQVRVFTTS